jgi:catechol 2,3-dioxygenase-like lactoylglutathione lyase family enzyme
LARNLAAVALLVPDYDSAIAWFCGALGFELVEDVALSEGKRWVVVAASRTAGARLVLAKAEGARQREAIGASAGGRVGHFLRTDDFARDHAEFQARGVRFLETPRLEPYGKVAVFADPWGGKWDLIEPARAGSAN